MATPPSAAGNRVEAERLLTISQKLLETRDLTGAREFSVLAQETEPLLEGSDQILAICDVLLASDRRTAAGDSLDWYDILQAQRRSSDLDLLKRNYRRLALLLHPDKNRYPLANSAFRLVADAWDVVSDPAKKAAYDATLDRVSRVELGPDLACNQPPSEKLPVRRSSRANVGGGGVSRNSKFWTACPYCYVLYEYPSVYEECCLRCQGCRRAFHAAVVPSLPPIVPGKEAYYCCWGFFPLGFSVAGAEGKKGASNAGGFPNWMPPVFSGGPARNPKKADVVPPVENPQGSGSGGVQRPVMAAGGGSGAVPKKRGRPRKNAL